MDFKPNVKITRTQLECIKEAADTLSGMVGVGTDFDGAAKRIVRNIDKFLANNNLAPRDFN